MPEASDGKKFPYTKKGMADYKKYQGSLDRYNKTMGFEHKTPNMLELMFRKLPVPDFLSNIAHGTGKTKAIKNRAMSDQMISGGKKKLVKGT
tara:strand:- start:216 stop:491 length:276 start_codon:yes stop_codon:yes gene_type:complete